MASSWEELVVLVVLVVLLKVIPAWQKRFDQHKVSPEPPYDSK